MGLRVIGNYLNGLVLFEPKVIEDERGFFMESFRADEFESMGLPCNFVQDNHSRSSRGVLRGLHFQYDKPQGKLIRVTLGLARVVEVDIRPGSPTLGKWQAFELSSDNRRVLWVPPGFANGFSTQSDQAEMQYKCTELWNPSGESNILWNDPAIGIDWQNSSPVISGRDSRAGTLAEWLGRAESRIFSM